MTPASKRCEQSTFKNDLRLVSRCLACTQLCDMVLIFPPLKCHAWSLPALQAILLGVLAFVMAFIVLSFCSSVSSVSMWLHSCCCHTYVDKLSHQIAHEEFPPLRRSY